MLLYFVFWATVIGGGLYFVARLVRAFEQRSQVVEPDVDLHRRLQVLEDVIERQSTEIQLLTENQQFLERLLAGRGTALPSGPDAPER
jgi:hypothetical protein